MSLTRKNEVSGLLIMGLIGGTVFPFAMGFASDAIHTQSGAVAVLLIAVVYLAFYCVKLKK
jgi:fucose permease